uniref:Calmodulin n=1 Tax=Florenciella parvula TaxID=236787 RepID=A0A7S2C3J7_9STRA
MALSSTKDKKRPLQSHRKGDKYDLSSVPKNEKGGVLVTDDELAAAFEFFDMDGSGKITMTNLRKRLGVFYKNMPAKDYRFLMNNKPELTLQDLRELLLDNEVTNFDPVAEAFKVYDPEGTGFVDHKVLRDMFQNLGFGEVTDEDLQILVETGDVDQDGKISLSDFRNMLDFNRAQVAAQEAADLEREQQEAEREALREAQKAQAGEGGEGPAEPTEPAEPAEPAEE